MKTRNHPWSDGVEDEDRVEQEASNAHIVWIILAAVVIFAAGAVCGIWALAHAISEVLR